MGYFRNINELKRVGVVLRDTVRDMGVYCEVDEITVYDVCTDFLLSVDDPDGLQAIQSRLETDFKVALGRDDIIVKAPANDTDDMILVMLTQPLESEDDGPTLWEWFWMLIRKE